MVKQRGIALVEIITTISVIGIIMAIAVPSFTRARLKARESELRQTLHTVREAADRMAADTGTYPLTLADLTRSTAPAEGFVAGRRVGHFWFQLTINPADWKGPYLRRVPTDPITGAALGYATLGHQDHPVFSSNNTFSSEGTRYNTW